ncbi:PDZ domain-containing protein [candidate division WOR-3 bacterium]|nr:PDZ domain-containing protein [candidate division WOR-3 bacterium]
MKYLSVMMVLLSSTSAADWQENLQKLLETNSASRQENLIEKIAQEAPGWKEVSDYLVGLEFREKETDTVLLRKTTCIDGDERSWILYIPPSYDPVKPTPLFVNLHGGVSSPEPIPDSSALERMEDNIFKKMAGENGWLMLFPFGQFGATWWDSVGMANINNLVRTVKREFNVDDDRVWMGGYSDGASGSFLYGMLDPRDYAAFLALSGHIGVGSLDGCLPTYAPNLANTPTYAVTSFADELYPSAKMRPTVKMAQDAGGDIYYREQEGRHEFAYAEDEAERLVNFLDRHPRDPFIPKITWETADPGFGKCRWFSIDEVEKEADAADWHVDYNATLVNDRVTIGFNVPEYEGEGVKVGKVFDGTAADSMGLEEDDVIIHAEDMEILGMDDLNAYKQTKVRGDSIHMTVIRANEEIKLHGKLPEPTEYKVFNHTDTSARANVTFFANRIDVEGSRVGAFTIYVHPDMIRLEHPLVITCNGKEVYNQKVEPDIRFMLNNFLGNRDRSLIYVAEVKIEL